MHRIHKHICLNEHHVPTGKTKHYLGNDEIPHVAKLQIVSFEDSDDYYLLYFDAAGNELTDTLHDSIKAAMEQAEWEFQVKPEEWQ